jgi:hypothetical protein
VEPGRFFYPERIFSPNDRWQYEGIRTASGVLKSLHIILNTYVNKKEEITIFSMQIPLADLSRIIFRMLKGYCLT